MANDCPGADVPRFSRDRRRRPSTDGGPDPRLNRVNICTVLYSGVYLVEAGEASPRSNGSAEIEGWAARRRLASRITLCGLERSMALSARSCSEKDNWRNAFECDYCA